MKAFRYEVKGKHIAEVCNLTGKWIRWVPRDEFEKLKSVDTINFLLNNLEEALARWEHGEEALLLFTKFKNDLFQIR